MRVLAIGAHPDDVEFGCGGTLLKHLDAGDEVHTLVMTNGEGGNADSRVRKREAKVASFLMGVGSIRFGGLDAREMSCMRHGYDSPIQDVMNDVNPHRIYCHSENDRHQNHAVVAKCSLIAGRRVPQVFSFRLPSTTADFRPTFYVDVTDQMVRKLVCIAAFMSQAGKDYMQEWWLKAVAAGYAMEAHFGEGRLAEAFYVERMVW